LSNHQLLHPQLDYDQRDQKQKDQNHLLPQVGSTKIKFTLKQIASDMKSPELLAIFSNYIPALPTMTQ